MRKSEGERSEDVAHAKVLGQDCVSYGAGAVKRRKCLEQGERERRGGQVVQGLAGCGEDAGVRPKGDGTQERCAEEGRGQPGDSQAPARGRCEQSRLWGRLRPSRVSHPLSALRSPLSAGC